MSKGIYCYIDNENDEVVYVGRDSNIHEDKRHKQHFQPSRYDKQVINRVLQNNPDRYIYQRLWEIEDCTDNHLNEMEKYYTKIYNPKLSFTEGGDGTSGYKWTDEQKKKKSGENHPMYGRTGEKSPVYGRKHTEEELKKMSEKKKGENNPMYGKKRTEEWKKQQSERIRGENNPRAKYKLWDISYVYYNKGSMFKNNRTPNPCRCFYYKYNGYCLPISYFHDFITPQVINSLISDALSEDSQTKC